MPKILVVDLGTTYFKITLFDRDGRLCDTCRLAPPVKKGTGPICRNGPEGASHKLDLSPFSLELDVDAFESVLANGIGELADRTSGGLTDVEAITFATQTNSFVLLDADDRPLTPIILWPDRRAAELEPEVHQRCEFPEFAATTGIPQVNCEFVLAKLLWLRQHCPDIWKQTGKLCLISDYLTLLSTGRHVTEAGAAGLTGLLDIHRCRWWPEILARFEIGEQWLPEVVRAATDLGPIDSSAAQRFGLPNTCRFVVGCLDQYAGAIGAGNVEPGTTSETTGTVLATVQCADRLATDLGSAVFQGPAFRDGLYWRMAFGDVSANYLHWHRDQLPDRPDFDQLTASAGQIEPGAGGLILKTDVVLSDAKSVSVFEGMTPQHTPGHAVRCIMEAVAWALGDQVTVLSRGALPAEIRSTGGAARSDVWLQIKADILGVAMTATECPEPTSLGAAILAEAAIGGTDVRSVARQWVRLKSPHRPDPQRQQLYQVLR